jgi:hypothetical protein
LINERLRQTRHHPEDARLELDLAVAAQQRARRTTTRRF